MELQALYACGCETDCPVIIHAFLQEKAGASIVVVFSYVPACSESHTAGMFGSDDDISKFTCTA